MRFRLTSIADQGLGAKLTPALIALEDWLNVSLCDGVFGGHLSSLLIVVFATESLPRKPAASRTFSATNPLTGARESTLALHLEIAPAALHSLQSNAVLPEVANWVVKKLPAKLARTPKGLEYDRLRSALALSINAYASTSA